MQIHVRSITLYFSWYPPTPHPHIPPPAPRPLPRTHTHTHTHTNTHKHTHTNYIKRLYANFMKNITSAVWVVVAFVAANVFKAVVTQCRDDNYWSYKRIVSYLDKQNKQKWTIEDRLTHSYWILKRHLIHPLMNSFKANCLAMELVARHWNG